MAASGAAGDGDEPIREAAAAAAPVAGKKWLNVVLDIDETFIQFGEDVDFAALLPEEERKKYTILSRTDKTGKTIPQFILRPGFDRFFAWLRDNCKTVNLWTLSDAEYADGVKSKIETRIPGLKINLVLDVTHNKEATEYFGGRKNLKYIWNEKGWSKTFNQYNTVLIDDLNASTEEDNSPNGIKIPPFSPLGLSQDKVKHGGRKRKGPYVDFSEDHVLADIIEVLKGIPPPSRPFKERVVVEGIHRPDEDIHHAGKRRKTRRGKKARKTKTRR